MRFSEFLSKRSLGSPGGSSFAEVHVSFKIGSDFKNFAENQLNPCTIVHGFLSIWVRFSEFTKLVQNVPEVVSKSCE